MRRFLPGELVQIKEIGAILATLDERGTLKGLPFMPEMQAFCGQVFQVHQRAQKFCIENGDVGSYDDVVFLRNVRCSGVAHAGCGRGCLIFWKEAWLSSLADGQAASSIVPLYDASSNYQIDSPEKNKAELARIRKLAVQDERFFCQSTELMRTARPLNWWRLGQYKDDIFIAGASPWLVLKSVYLLLKNKVAQWCNEPARGAIPGLGRSGDNAPLNLIAGERVRVKSLAEIRRTLDRSGKHKGLIFTAEMAEFCGREYNVQRRVEQFILEHQPAMKSIKNTVLLDGVACNGVCRRLCTRNSLYFWRESWLERSTDIVT